MSEVVLDASAILALVRHEAGAEVVSEIVARSIASTVNASEAIAKLVEFGVSPDRAEEIVFTLPMETVDFDAAQAAAAGKMWLRGKPAGLSFGDRACLALAEGMSLPVVTADHRWKGFTSTVDINYIR